MSASALRGRVCGGEGLRRAVAPRTSEVADLQGRRDFIRRSGVIAALVGCGLGASLVPTKDAMSASAPDIRSFNDALNRLGGIPAESGQITLTLPAYVEDGAVVPVAIRSDLESSTDIYVLSDVNPVPLAVGFKIADGTMPEVSIRIKLQQSGAVFAVVRADRGLFWTSSQIKVTVGGCSS
jgi:sulfur-oxidizing protein SoxY